MADKQRVLKTVPRSDQQRSQRGARRTLLLAVLLSAVVSFGACVLLLNRLLLRQPEQAELQELLASKVPAMLFGMPVVAFGGVMLLNILNLPNSRNDTRWRSNLCLCFVNFVALTTDTLIFLRLTPVVVAGNGRLIHPLRYIQWTHSTPTMIHMVSMMADLTTSEVWFAMANDVSMVLTGLMSTLSSALELRLVWGAASFINFGVVLLYLARAVRSAAREAGDHHSRRSLRIMLGLMMVMWSCYPAAWLLAECRMLTPAMEQLIWAILDYMAKAVFTSQLWQANIKSIEERRMAALQAWENSNRAMVVDKLRHLVAAKERILHTMSHELRTPLLGILAMASSLLRDTRKNSPPGPSEQREQVRQLAMVRSCASCLLNIVTTTLDAAAANDGQGAEGGSNSAGSQPPGSPRVAGSLGQAPRRHALRLRSLVDDVASLIRPLVNEGVALTNEVPSDLPLVAADAKRLSQVFFNLIGNAARFTHTGFVRVTATPIGDSSVEVTVSDSGVGLSQESIESVFNTTSKDDIDLAAANGGMGLGLYLVKLALGSLGSSIKVESQLGKGTAFSFALPVAGQDDFEAMDAEQQSDGSRSSSETVTANGAVLTDGRLAEHLQQQMHQPAGTSSTSLQARLGQGASVSAPSSTTGLYQGASGAQQQQQGGAGPGAGGMRRQRSSGLQAPAGGSEQQSGDGARVKLPNRFTASRWQILSVDDDQINQLVAEQVLKREKWQVVKAFDGLQALEYIEKADMLPDLILLDIMMPVMNGFELCTKLRERYSSALLPIVMVSAKGGESDVITALRCGADDYLTKPFRSGELLERIKAHLRVRDSARRFEVLAALAGGSFNMGSAAPDVTPDSNTSAQQANGDRVTEVKASPANGEAPHWLTNGATVQAEGLIYDSLDLGLGFNLDPGQGELHTSTERGYQNGGAQCLEPVAEPAESQGDNTTSHNNGAAAAAIPGRQPDRDVVMNGLDPTAAPGLRHRHRQAG